MSKVVVTSSKGKKQLQYAQVASEQLKWFIFVTASRFQMILVQKEQITKKNMQINFRLFTRDVVSLYAFDCINEQKKYWFNIVLIFFIIVFS